ncbi:hypothetical protein Tco_0074589, partial [Tanacetum coccineum]
MRVIWGTLRVPMVLQVRMRGLQPLIITQQNLQTTIETHDDVDGIFDQ